VSGSGVQAAEARHTLSFGNPRRAGSRGRRKSWAELCLCAPGAIFRRPSRLTVPAADTTLLLAAARAGDPAAREALWPHVYAEMKTLARARLRALPSGETLTPTALVHEAYLRLVDGDRTTPADRTHFFALAGRAMRFILVDHARARTAAKRGGSERPLSLDGLPTLAAPDAGDRAADLLALDRALDGLARLDPRLAEVVELRFFAGLPHEDVAAATGRSVPTVKRDWQRARAWLYRAMREETPDTPATA
jgi:RNA polymerase sigma factor (TIGR02999 family)